MVTPIKNIIFDLGGVLINLNYQLTRIAFENLGVQDFDAFYTQHKANPLFENLEVGAIEPETFYEALRKATGLTLSNAQLENAWNAMLLDFPADRLQWLDQIKNKYNIYLFSNTNAIHYKAFTTIYAQTAPLIGLNPNFNHFFIEAHYSHTLGQRKPDVAAFEAWKKSNVIKQKQAGYVAIGIKVSLGDFYTDKARQLADLIKNYAANELRFSLRQNILIRNVKEENLPFFYQELAKLDFVTLGYDSTADITACPGTDTCNLGIASSTGIATELERVLAAEYPQYSNNQGITIKISGCMNACGQHNMAEIGFQGMSINSGKLVAPALQVLLGGGNLGNGQGRFADKVIKIPSRRGPEALRFILNDFESNANELNFLDYYDAKGEKYFFELLKPLSETDNLTEEDFVDWGNADNYVKAIGVGECAGVVIDLVATLLFEAKDKLTFAQEAFDDKKWSDAIYLAYAGFVNGAKAILLAENQKTNAHAGIIDLFDTVFVETNKIALNSSFKDLVYQINQNEPSEEFAKKYIQEGISCFENIESYRTKDLANE